MDPRQRTLPLPQSAAGGQRLENKCNLTPCPLGPIEMSGPVFIGVGEEEELKCHAGGQTIVAS